MRIFLTGMMGCGKTYWGKKIASANDMLFMDLDVYIEEKYSMAIPEIFQREGEDFFREKEGECLREIIQQRDSFVLATGGGTPCFYDHIRLMKEAGKVYYLKTEISVLAKRIFEGDKIRPLVKKYSLEKVTENLQEIFLKRKKCYEQSDTIIDMNRIDEINFAKNFFENDK